MLPHRHSVGPAVGSRQGRPSRAQRPAALRGSPGERGTNVALGDRQTSLARHSVVGLEGVAAHTKNDLAGADASRLAGPGGLWGVQGGKQAEELGKQRAESAFAPGEAERLVGVDAGPELLRGDSVGRPWASTASPSPRRQDVSTVQASTQIPAYVAGTRRRDR